MSDHLALGRRLVALAVGVGLISLHWTWGATRAHPLGGPDDNGILPYLPLAVLLLLSGGLLAWLARTVWLLQRVRRAMAGLVTLPWPTQLRTAVQRAGINAVDCVRDPSPAAFCVGAVRPRVIVTTGLAERLGVEELVAVLLHEGEHAHRRDPLRRAAWRAAAEVLWHVPVVEWWSRHELERSELAADRVALARLGPGPLARALTTAARPGAGCDQAGFDGAAALRVAQLLGDPLPAGEPSRSVYLVSACTALVTMNLAMCLVETAAHLAR